MNEEPLVSVVRGTPTDLELAALIAIVAARSAAVDARPARPATPAWARSARPSIGHASWRSSGLPR
jgi:hypothetical protein